MIRAHHGHDGDRLTVGCPECVRLRDLALRRQALADAPVREVWWRFRLPGHRWPYGFMLHVRVPAGWTRAEIDDHYAGDTGLPISRIVAYVAPGDETAMWQACETIECSSIGRVVPQAVPVIEGQGCLL